MTPEVVLATLLRLALWSGDATEPPDARATRLQDIAVGVAAASASWDEAAFLLSLGELETHFAAYTQHPTTCLAGPRGARCDHGRAYGYWSLHYKACPALWELPAADQRAVYVGAQCAVQLYRYGRFACKAPGGAFALYAGRRCGDPIGERRLQRMRQVRVMLEH